MAEPLLIIPTLLADARIYASVINGQLPRRAVQVALPTGGRTIPEIARKIIADAPPRFALFGHGLGALVALEIAIAVPSRVSRLIMVGGTAQTQLPAVTADQEHLLVKAESGALGAAVLALSGVDKMAPGPERDALQDSVLAMSFDLGVPYFVSQLRALQRRPDQQAGLRKIKCPCLMIAAREDPVFSARQVEMMAHVVTQSQFHQCAGAGFWLPVEMPGRLAEMVEDFLPEPLILQ